MEFLLCRDNNERFLLLKGMLYTMATHSYNGSSKHTNLSAIITQEKRNSLQPLISAFCQLGGKYVAL